MHFQDERMSSYLPHQVFSETAELSFSTASALNF
uniref:Bm1493 n=1 Tax=Brugia malayi TaxID=6279 RepID=A0A1I9G4T7_BRUMA|nr:Bm1493 [Brugia malayi]